MIIRQDQIDFPAHAADFPENSPELCLFFDIETTGLSWKRSHLYMLGVIFYENAHWYKKLWFCQKPSEESDVLREFSPLLNSRKHLMHYNGTTFDIPYLMHKYTFYQHQQSWEHLISHDFYHMARPFQRIWDMKSMKQKDLEQKFGVVRTDPYSGKDLISFYQQYLKNADETLLEALFLHNSEDMDGLLLLLPLFYLQRIFEGDCRTFDEIRIISRDECFTLRVTLTESVPCSFVLDTGFFQLDFQQNICDITIPIAVGTKKYFFSDYKNYYYLRYEDCAIHKSVGTYVDKEYRENAKPSNCYQKKDGGFLPVFQDVFSPVYRDSFRDKHGWIAYTPEFLDSSDQLCSYVSHLFSSALALWKVQTKVRTSTD